MDCWCFVLLFISNMKEKHKLLIGKKFGNLIIKNIVEFYSNTRPNQKDYKAEVYCELCNNVKTVGLRGILTNKTIACGCLKSKNNKRGLNSPLCKDLTNKRFTHLTALYIDKSKTNRTFWICKCDCGNVKSVATKHLTGNYIKSCGCKQSLKRKLSNSWKGYEEISGRQWSRAKSGAVERNFEFNISMEYAWNMFLKQNRKCALSGVELKFGIYGIYHGEIDGNASLDRIDSSKGYIEGNIQWVHKKVNTMKMNMSEPEFINWCKLITENKSK